MMIHERTIMAGFGGQGIMFMGELLAQAGMLAGYHVTWMPSYGPEMRGGTANCSVVISTERIASPLVSRPDTVVAMNGPSVDKFGPLVRDGGLLIYNTSLKEKACGRSDIKVIGIAAERHAEKIGNGQVANMVMLGAFNGHKDLFNREVLHKALNEVLKPGREELESLNQKALSCGADLIRDGEYVQG